MWYWIVAGIAGWLICGALAYRCFRADIRRDDVLKWNHFWRGNALILSSLGPVGLLIGLVVLMLGGQDDKPAKW